jgi:uncharacterized membrane protein (DUF485 family)
MLNVKLTKNQVGVLLALLAVVLVCAAVYVYRANKVSEPFEGKDSDSETEDDEEVEGFENFASVP